MTDSDLPSDATSVMLVSGGPGAVGQLLLDTLIAQFPARSAEVSHYNNVRSCEQLEQALKQAAQLRALVIHSLVESDLRIYLTRRAAELDLETHDVFGELIGKLAQRFGCEPLSAPGRYRALRRDYYERIDAIEFTIEHDDSRNLDSIHGADIILVGVSRTGKTPLSMYLAMQGWKTANVSFLPNIDWPPQLDQVAHGRIVGLTIDRERLMVHRRQRSTEVGLGPSTAYSSEESLFLELEALLAAFKKHRLPVLDVTEKPMETTAQEVIRIVSQALGESARKR